MKIEDNSHWVSYPCIWIESGNFNIDIQKEDVEILCDWDYGHGGRGSERIFINRKQLIELLSKLDIVL